MAVSFDSNEIVTSVDRQLSGGSTSTDNMVNQQQRLLSGFADGSDQPLLPSVEVSPGQSVAKRSSQYTSCSSAVFLTVNAALGAGLLNIPYAFDESGGVVYASFIHGFLVFFVICSFFILTHAAEISGAVSYQELIGAFCGSAVLNLCVVFIIFYCYGCCLTFVIIVGDQFDRIFLSLYGLEFCHTWYLNRKFTMFVCCTLFVLPLSFSKKIDFLKYASLFGSIASFYVIFLAFYEYLKTDTEKIVIKTRPNTWPELFYVTPVIVFAYQCQLTWIPIYAGMKERSGSVTISLTILISIVICFFCYTMTAFFGLMTFGSKLIKPDLMENYDANDSFALSGIIILVAKTVTIYPLMLFCGRVAVEDLMIKYLHLEPNSKYEIMRRIAIVLIWFFSTIVIAILIPNISTAIKLLGIFAAFFVYIFPGMCSISVITYKDPQLHLVKDRFYLLTASTLIVLGTFVFGLTLVQVIVDVFIDDSSDGDEFQLLCQ